jgi:hypothetical protein
VRLSAVATLVLLVAAVGTACGGSTDEAASPPSLTETAAAPADPTRQQAPQIAGTSLEGDAIALGDFRGRPVLVNVWSSW